MDDTSKAQVMADPQDIESASPPSTVPSWSQVWHLPVLLVGLALFGVGMYLAIPHREPPDFDGQLQSIGQYLKAGNFDGAREGLKHLATQLDQAPAPVRGEFSLLRGDLFYLNQRDKGWNEPAQHKTVIESYQDARDQGLTLDALRHQRLAETLAALGQETEALKVLDQVTEGPAQRRYLVLRQIIQRRIDQGGGLSEGIDVLLDRFLTEVARETDPAASLSQRIWAVAARMQLLLDAGKYDELIARMHLEMAQLRDVAGDRGDKDLAPLHVILADAYRKLGSLQQARLSYLIAQQKLDRNAPAQGEHFARSLVGLGQVGLAEAEKSGELVGVREALGLFGKTVSDYPTTAYVIDALVGMADCESRLGAHPEAIEHLKQAVARVVENPQRLSPMAAAISEVATRRHRVADDAGTHDLAIKYLESLLPLHGQNVPAEVVLALAQSYERLAAQRFADAMGMPAEPRPGEDGDAAKVLRKTLLREAAVHFEKAGDYYTRHRATVTIKVVDAYASSLWKSALCYDRAQHWKKAIDAYQTYVTALPGDPRQLQAMHRLGLAFQADSRHADAAAVFRQLVEDNPTSTEAYASLVPLAQCYVRLNDDNRAKQVLLAILDGHRSITPDSAEYRGALVELGKLHYRLKEYEPAIERLSEAVKRYGESREGPALHFFLADALRLSSAQLRQATQEPMPPARLAAIQADRARRLEQAFGLYDRVITDLDRREQDQLLDIDRLQLRNAFFYRADCIYDLAQYERAIQLYDLAARRFEKHPASLIALVQIVNANCSLQRYQEAWVANKAAREHLKRIPKEAFDDPSLPMTRQHWEDWYRWTSQLNLFGPQASVGPRAATAPASP